MADIRRLLWFDDVGLQDVPEVGGKDASHGPGGSVAKGGADPDEYYVHEPTLLEGFLPVLQQKLGSKEFELVFEEEEGSRPTRSVPVAAEERRRFVLSDEEILPPARWGARGRSTTPGATACRPRWTRSGRRTATPTCHSWSRRDRRRFTPDARARSSASHPSVRPPLSSVFPRGSGPSITLTEE